MNVGSGNDLDKKKQERNRINYEQPSRKQHRSREIMTKADNSCGVEPTGCVLGKGIGGESLAPRGYSEAPRGRSFCTSGPLKGGFPNSWMGFVRDGKIHENPI